MYKITEKMIEIKEKKTKNNSTQRLNFRPLPGPFIVFYIIMFMFTFYFMPFFCCLLVLSETRVPHHKINSFIIFHRILARL